jgi:hypothetical protein
VPVFELQGGDLVIEEGGLVDQARSLGTPARLARRRADGGWFRPGVALEVRLLTREGVAERGADGLVEAALRTVGESSFGEVAVVDVAGGTGWWKAGCLSPLATRWIRSTIVMKES